MAEYISAEIPSLPRPGDRTQAARLQRNLHNSVKTHNIHTCKQGRCKKPDRPNCNKRFPVILNLKIIIILCKFKKPYSQDNRLSENNYPVYKRRPPARSEAERLLDPEYYGNIAEHKDKSKKIHTYTNAYVVPYNPFLTAKYNSQ